MQKKYRKGTLAVGALLLVVGAYAKTTVFAPPAQANDAQDAVSSNQEQSNTANKNFGNNESESTKKAQEVQQESAKKAQELQQESAKKAQEVQQESIKNKQNGLTNSLTRGQNSHENGGQETGKNGNLVGNNDNIDVNENTDAENSVGNNEDNGGSEQYEHLTEKIAEAQQYIAEQQSQGKDVTLAQAMLAQAQAKLKTINISSPDAQGINESEDLVKESFTLAHATQGEDIHTGNDLDQFIRKASDRIEKTNEKLSQLVAAGGTATQYQAMIDVATADVNSAKEMLLKNSLAEGTTLAQKAGDEAKSAQKAIEAASLALGINDDALSDDYKTTVTQAADDLTYVANVEGDGKIGTRVRDIAKAQKESADTVNTLVSSTQSRSKFAEFMIGPKYSDLKGIQDQIISNQTNIQALTQVVDQLTDPNLKQVVQEHITALTEENTKLQSFVDGKETQKGIFGWLFRLLQN
jgi:hypothetical protein